MDDLLFMIFHYILNVFLHHVGSSCINKKCTLLTKSIPYFEIFLKFGGILTYRASICYLIYFLSFPK